jgi:enoyl-CoA hydratase/carnithine racemase
MSLVESSVIGRLGYLRLTRPRQRNALSRELVAEATAAIGAFVREGATMAILKADPPVFCAGNDLDEMDPDSAAAPDFLKALLTSPLFWVVVVDGPAYGAGVAVAACCPVVIATERSSFELPEWRLGLFPAPVTGHLEAVIGIRAAFTAALSGDRITAADAARCGLVTEVVDATESDAAVSRWVDHLAARPEAADAARRAWQDRFLNGQQRDRIARLDDNMRAQLSNWQGRGAEVR